MELNVLACEKDMILGDPRVECYGLNAAPPNSYLEAPQDIKKFFWKVLMGEASMMGLVS